MGVGVGRVGGWVGGQRWGLACQRLAAAFVEVVEARLMTDGL